MRRNILLSMLMAFFLIVIMTPQTEALEWTPLGNISMQSTYWILDLVGISGDLTTTGDLFVAGTVGNSTDRYTWGELNTTSGSGDCPSGQFVQNITSNTIECAATAGSGDITAVNAGTGLIGGGASGDVTLNVSAEICGSGNVSKYNGTHFNCIAASGSTYSAGSNLTLTGTTFSVNTTGLTEWLDNVYAGIATIFDGTWTSLTGKPTVLSNFTDDLGDRGYTSLTNFSNDLGIGNWSADQGNYYTSTQTDTEITNANSSMKTYVDGTFVSTEVDPFWDSNESTVARIGDCPSGQFVQNTTIGGVECATPGGAGGGTVTSVATDDTYLTGGPITSTGTITLNTTLAGISLAVNSSDNWDNLGSPSDIGTGDITDDGTWRLDSWDNFTGTPVATPSDADITHLSTADQIYDYIVSLSYLVAGDLVGLLGNWSADKADYSTTAEAGALYATIDEPLWTANQSSYSTKTVADGLYAGITEPVALSLGNWSSDSGDYYTSTETDTEIESANTSMKTYVDAQDVATNTSMKTYVDGAFEPISAHFDATTVNITCFNSPTCDWYMNATDSCQYWPSGGKDCGAA